MEAVRSRAPGNGLRGLCAGHLYRVRSVEPDRLICENCGEALSAGLNLDGDAPYTSWLWCFCDVRPVYRPRADLIETLLQSMDGVKPTVDA